VRTNEKWYGFGGGLGRNGDLDGRMISGLVSQIHTLRVEEVVSIVDGILRVVKSASSSVDIFSSVVVAVIPLEDREYSNIVERSKFGSVELPIEG
jgi:hypothetical protein